jgi:hypothetical protein
MDRNRKLDQIGKEREFDGSYASRLTCPLSIQIDPGRARPCSRIALVTHNTYLLTLSIEPILGLCAIVPGLLFVLMDRIFSIFESFQVFECLPFCCHFANYLA